MEQRKHGPHFMKLVFRKIAKDAVPDGSGFADGIVAGLDLFTTPGRFSDLAHDAFGWVEAAIQTVRSAPDNPYGDDEETIAGVILAQLEKRDFAG